MGSLSQGIFEKGYKMGKEQAMKEFREKEIEIGKDGDTTKRFNQEDR